MFASLTTVTLERCASFPSARARRASGPV